VKRKKTNNNNKNNCKIKKKYTTLAMDCGRMRDDGWCIASSNTLTDKTTAIACSSRAHVISYFSKIIGSLTSGSNTVFTQVIFARCPGNQNPIHLVLS
jgi:hypothetical protein